MNINMNRVKRRALNEELKFHSPNSKEYKRIVAEMKQLDWDYHNFKSKSSRHLPKEEMLAILSTPVQKQ